jgi:hypothetical protein
VDVVDAEVDQPTNLSAAPPVKPKSKNIGKRYVDDEEEGVAYKSLVGDDAGKKQKMILMNTDKAKTVRGAVIKIIFTEDTYIAKTASLANPTDYRYNNDLPANFEEILRTKAKVMGAKESGFIQGSQAVMDMFRVAQIVPFVPKSDKVYTVAYKMGAGTDDDNMPTLDFEVTDSRAEFYMQVSCYDAENDLFATVVSLPADGDPPERVARSDLGKYANSIGPVVLSRGRYRLIIHPDLMGDE